MYQYKDIIGFPPAPAQPVHFARIDETLITAYRQRGWAFEYAHQLEACPKVAYKVVEWSLKRNEAQS